MPGEKRQAVRRVASFGRAVAADEGAAENLHMMLIQLLLPSKSSTGEAILHEPIAETRAELVERFGGVTAFVRSPARGAWTSPQGDLEQDDVVMVEVMAPSSL